MAEQRGPVELAHDRLDEFIVGIGQDRDLIACPQRVEESARALQRPQALDDALDIGQPQSIALQNLQSPPH
jgi:hypothetical protein